MKTDTIIDKAERAKLLLSSAPEKGDEFHMTWGTESRTGRIAEVTGNRVALLWNKSLTYTVHEFSVK